MTAALAVALTVVLCLAGCSDDNPAGPGEPTPLEVADFASAETCRSCHPDHVEQWEGSMHAYSTSDPVWRAGVQGEWDGTNGATGPFCLQCHAPIGFVTGVQGPFVIESLPAVVREGITCTVCHSMKLPSPAVDDDGAVYHLDPRGPQLGPIADPVETPAHASAATSVLSRSSVCLPCHDLFIGGLRAEITYSEWVESAYAPMGFECQTCHLPASQAPAAVDGPVRAFHDHRMIGVDIALVDFPHAEENRQLVEELLQRSVEAELSIPEAVATEATLDFQVTVFNTGAGHSIPSGASFLREMWLQVVVRSATGDTLLESGLRDELHNVIEDPFLHTFQSTIETSGPSLTDLSSIDNSPLIPALGSRTADYSAQIPAGTAGPLTVEAAVHFRSFVPANLRTPELEQYIDLIAEPFVMATAQGTVTVNP